MVQAWRKWTHEAYKTGYCCYLAAVLPDTDPPPFADRRRKYFLEDSSMGTMPTVISQLELSHGKAEGVGSVDRA